MNSIIFGVNTVLEALKEDSLSVEKIFILKGKKDSRISSIISLGKSKKSKIFLLDKNNFQAKFSNFNHQGVVAEITDYRYYSIDDLINGDKEKKFILILDSIQDQQNFGNIVRTAEFFGIDGIVIAKDKSAKINSATFKISSGAIFHIPIAKEINLSNVLLKLKDNFFTIVSTSPEGNDDFSFIKNIDNIALIIGNEEKGVRKNLLKKSDYVLKLRKYGKTSSLNASSAAAIFIYEIKKAMNI